jgi:hypothetical protein
VGRHLDKLPRRSSAPLFQTGLPCDRPGLRAGSRRLTARPMTEPLLPARVTPSQGANSRRACQTAAKRPGVPSARWTRLPAAGRGSSRGEEARARVRRRIRGAIRNGACQTLANGPGALSQLDLDRLGPTVTWVVHLYFLTSTRGLTASTHSSLQSLGQTRMGRYPLVLPWEKTSRERADSRLVHGSSRANWQPISLFASAQS